MNRRYDFDWLRGFGALLVVVAHCTMRFTPWFAAYAVSFGFPQMPTSRLLSQLVWNLNLWLMPLFMLLAGASAWYALGRRSNGRYLRERLVHLGAPFIVMLLVLIIPAMYFSRALTGGFSGTLPEFYLHFFDGVFPNGNYTLFHLWFLGYLLVYSLLTLPLFRFLRGARGRRLTDRLARACRRPGGLYLFALPLVIVQLALAGTEPNGFTQPFVNDWTKFAALLLVFIFGYVLISDARFQAAIAGQWRLALAFALAGSAVMAAVAWPENFNPVTDLPRDYSWGYAAFWTAFALTSWSWLLAWLGFGRRFLNVDHPRRAQVAAASFPLYLLHPAIEFPAVMIVAAWAPNAYLGAGALLAADLVGTLALTALLKRWSLTRALLGLKAARPAPAGSPAAGSPSTAAPQRARPAAPALAD